MTDCAARATEIRIQQPYADAGVDLVCGVSFELQRGEILGVVGETGAGKTLTTKALLGLVPSGLRASGSVEIVGERLDLARVGSDQRPAGFVRNAGVVLQNPASMFDPVLKIGKQLTEAVLWDRLLNRTQANERAAEILQGVGFPRPDAVMALYPHQLSGGMAQRAAIAMALMTRPQVLVVDEPTSALDANIRNDVLKLISHIAQTTGCAVVLVSHDLPLVARFTGRLMVMYSGRVIESGVTADVLSTPQHPYTRALLASTVTVASPTREPVATIPGSPPRPDERPVGCAFRPRCPFAADECAEQVPLLENGDGRAVACARTAVLPTASR